MAYMYLLSFLTEVLTGALPLLPLHTLSYLTLHTTNMAASLAGTRPGAACSAAVSFGERPTLNSLRGAFPIPYPRPKIHTAGLSNPLPPPRPKIHTAGDLPTLSHYTNPHGGSGYSQAMGNSPGTTFWGQPLS